jgi:hypothetical protein
VPLRGLTRDQDESYATQRDLGLAYSPGVAEACLAIVDEPREAGNLTARNNLVAVITNATAVPEDIKAPECRGFRYAEASGGEGEP